MQSLYTKLVVTLAAIRIEIEKHLRLLAEHAGVRGIDLDASAPLPLLRDGGLLGAETACGLDQLIRAGNRAAHGAMVSPEIAAWANNVGRRVLLALEQRINA